MGRRVVDKLVKVARQHALPDLWIFIHIEIQGAYEDAFEKRMYVYNYRLFDRYDRPVVSLAVLGDAAGKTTERLATSAGVLR